LNIKIPANVLAVDLLNGIEGVHCIRPNATFYLYPNVSGAMKKTGLTNYDDFRRTFCRKPVYRVAPVCTLDVPWKGKTIFTFNWPIRVSSR
jgi:aspartate/methionine/tyrosine aminotransferase